MGYRPATDQRNAEWLKTLLRCCGVGLWDALLHDGDLMHPKTRWTWSDEFRRLLGYRDEAEFPNTLQSWLQSLHPDDVAPTLEAARATYATGIGFDVTYRLRVRAGSYRWFRATGGVILDEDGRAQRACGSLTDIHDAVETEAMRRGREAAIRESELVRRSEQRLSVLIQNLSDVVLIIDLNWKVLYQSPAAETIWGYPSADLASQSLLRLMHPHNRRAASDLWRQLRDLPGATRSMELQLRQRSGAWRHVELVMRNLIHEPSIGGIVVTVHDIEERKTFEQRLVRLAFHDALTNLPNRALCQDRLDQALTRSRSSHSRIAVLIVDLDGFRMVNDGLGHVIGDQLLVAAAGRLLEVCGPDNTVARPGGDEFVIVLGGLAEDGAALEVARAVTRIFERPFTLGDRSLAISVSVGIAVDEAVLCSADTLLRNADIAVYHAKTTGKGRVVPFDPSMDSKGLESLELEAELRLALERDELCVHYQPIVELGSGRLLEVEALVRWNHPKWGLLLPAEFIPLAETTGLIIPLGQQVLEQACRQAARWQAIYAPDPPLVLSVNLSPRQFQQPSLDLEIAAILSRTGMDPIHLKLEITESVVMSDIERTIPILGRLKASGVKLAIDDFGTGYSSLAYLRRLPLDVLKIDRSFVSGIGQSQDDLAIIRAIISLAKSLRLSVTAEGIETATQAEILATLCCDRGQGYLFSPPVDAATATQMIEAAHGPAVVRKGQVRERSAEAA